MMDECGLLAGSYLRGGPMCSENEPAPNATLSFTNHIRSTVRLNPSLRSQKLKINSRNESQFKYWLRRWSRHFGNLWKYKFRYRVPNIPPPVHKHSQINAGHTPYILFSEIHFTTIIPSTTRSSKLSYSFRNSYQNAVCFIPCML
jgi:hypothetical protein